MILDMKPLSLADMKEHLKDIEENKELGDYLKKFVKLTKKESDKLKDEIKGLDNMKIKDGDLIKIVDFLPNDGEDLQKIFHDTSLDEKEINEILEIVKKY